MKTVFIILAVSLVGLVVLGVLVCILWRFLSKRMSLPCPSWFSWVVETDNPLAPVSHAANIVKNLGVKPGMRVLDAGCGPGRVTIPLALKVGPEGMVTAIDMQQGMILKAKSKAFEKELANIKFIQGKLGEDRLTTGAFDRANMVAVLGEIPFEEQQRALKEIYDALKPGGILGITEIIFDPHFVRKADVIDLALRMGFIEEKYLGNKLGYTALFKRP